MTLTRRQRAALEHLADAALYANRIRDTMIDPMTLEEWRQKDGTTVAVCNMDDEHIDRTIKMLCRTLEKAEEKTPVHRAINRVAPRAREWVMRNNRAWIERFTFELAERALGRRAWKPILSYVLARRIFDKAIANGATVDGAAKIVREFRRIHWLDQTQVRILQGDVIIDLKFNWSSDDGQSLR